MRKMYSSSRLYPPFAFAQARTLGRHLQTRFPRTKLVVGVWGFSGDMEKAMQRFQPLRPDKLVTSLADAVKWDPRASVATGT